MIDSSSEELLHRNMDVTIHGKNLQKLMLEAYRCVTSGKPCSGLWPMDCRLPTPPLNVHWTSDSILKITRHLREMGWWIRAC